MIQTKYDLDNQNTLSCIDLSIDFALTERKVVWLIGSYA